MEIHIKIDTVKLENKFHVFMPNVLYVNDALQFHF